MKLLKSYLFMIVFLVACSKPSQKNNSEAIARVNDNYLYRSDLENLVPPGSSKKDSVAIVKDFITRWAMQQLLMNKAEKNISKSKQQELDELISQYKNDLYTKSYLEELVMTKIDTVISNEEIEKYYNEHKNNFKTTEPLVKLRYINLIKGNVKFATINSKFLNFSKKDKLDLQKLAIQFKNYAFNDSIWVDIN